MANKKSTPSNVVNVPIDVVDVIDTEVIEEPAKIDSPMFCWVDPSPGLHDRLNILLRRRGITLQDAIGEFDNNGEKAYSDAIRIWAGFEPGENLDELVWLSVLGKLER
jgi:hypothetical protein